MINIEYICEIAIQANIIELQSLIEKVPHIHKQHTLDIVLEKVILMTPHPNCKVVKWLLDAGANPNASETNLIEYAETLELKGILKLLKHEETPTFTIKNYSKCYILVSGQTLPNLKKYKAIYSVKAKGWLIPVKYKKNVQELLQETKAETIDTIDTNFINSIHSQCVTIRPTIKLQELTPVSKYLTTNYEKPYLFKLDEEWWNSVTHYLSYKKYEGTPKGDAIKKAKNLSEAMQLYSNINNFKITKSPKQLLEAQKMLPLTTSKPSKYYLQHSEELYYIATQAKIIQSPFFKYHLLSTGSNQLFGGDYNDIFGYEGNMLGNCLMRIREELGGSKYSEKEILKTNSLVMEKYPGSLEFYVIRGDPTSELATKIRNLGNYKNNSGVVVRGKLSLNLLGGSGWLIPINNKKQAKQLVFETIPHVYKLEYYKRDWLKKQGLIFLDAAYVFSSFKGKQEINVDDLVFSIKELFHFQKYLGNTESRSEYPNYFKKCVIKYADANGTMITNTAIQFLWDCVNIYMDDISNNADEYDTLSNMFSKFNSTILEKHIPPITGLNELESATIHAFKYIYSFLGSINDSQVKKCIATVRLLLGNDHYEHVRKQYTDRIKANTAKLGKVDLETEFKYYFKIVTPHLSGILIALPSDLNKKCKLLILLVIDYINDLQDESAIELTKRIILCN